ncbi:hypothetical protein RAS1_26240 [Phycisphaerae bacterium RAS1]|nr:hypothetical protein RAS1_26240 [Phycisphaerae bacterium RAS1]
MRLTAFCLCLAVVISGGCAANEKMIEPQHGPITELTAAEADARAEAVRRDPLAYLKKVTETCRALDSYRLSFTRYERRGLLRILYGPEHIDCWFRREPFSIRMKWTDKDTKYGESVYIAGRHNNKVRFVPRIWMPPLLPGINTIDLDTPVIWGEAKRPLTAFGLQRLMEQTMASVDGAGEDLILRYDGLLRLEESGTAVHHLHIELPASRYKVNVQELYVSIATDLPAGTVLKFPSGTIDAAYFYAKIDQSSPVTDADLVMDYERERMRSKGSGTE